MGIFQKLKGFLLNRNECILCITFFIMALSNGLLLIENETCILTYIRFFNYIILLICLMFLGINSVFYIFTIYALVIMFFHNYNNFISYLIILIFCQFRKKFFTPISLIYFFNFFIISFINKYSVIEIIIHLGSCITLYLCLDKLFIKKTIKKEIKLDKSQRLILLEIIKGKQQKEIEGFSKNTITKKIQDAIKENNCKSREELIFYFMLQEDL
jgi:hypothetical protein